MEFLLIAVLLGLVIIAGMLLLVYILFRASRSASRLPQSGFVGLPKPPGKGGPSPGGYGEFAPAAGPGPPPEWVGGQDAWRGPPPGTDGAG